MKVKAKTNLELFKNEILYNLNHGKGITFYGAIVEVYERENKNKAITYEGVLDWCLDVPRETLYLSEFAYKFIKEYFSKLKAYKEWMVEEHLNEIICLDALIKIGAIPSKYGDMPFNEFIKIIRLKEGE